jgi:hypothetical protein
MRQENPFRLVRQQHAPSDLVFGKVSAPPVGQNCHAEDLTRKTLSMRGDTKASGVGTEYKLLGSATHQQRRTVASS